MNEDDLERRYETRLERFEHGPLALELRVPRAAEALIDEAEFDADERLPYWAELWPSARALARHLLTGPPPQGRVLELGCGVALPSLVLVAAGADVLATDYYPAALEFARHNARRNGLPALTTRLIDWRALPGTLGRFDLVIAADVMYERRHAEDLARAVPRLGRRGGRFLLADPGRSHLSVFCRRLEASGWASRVVATFDETSDPATAAVSHVRILEFRPGSAPPHGLPHA